MDLSLLLNVYEHYRFHHVTVKILTFVTSLQTESVSDDPQSSSHDLNPLGIFINYDNTVQVLKATKFTDVKFFKITHCESVIKTNTK